MNLRKLLCGLLALCLLLTMAPAALMEEAAPAEQVVELGEEVASEALDAEDYQIVTPPPSSAPIVDNMKVSLKTTDGTYTLLPVSETIKDAKWKSGSSTVGKCVVKDPAFVQYVEIDPSKAGGSCSGSVLLTMTNGSKYVINIDITSVAAPSKVEIWDTAENEKVEEKTLDVLLDGTFTVHAVAMPSKVAMTSIKYWTTSNSKVVAFNAAGTAKKFYAPKATLYALKKGKATIKVYTNNGKSASLKVTVKDKHEPTGVSIDASAKKIANTSSKSIQLTAHVKPVQWHDGDGVKWTVNKSKIVALYTDSALTTLYKKGAYTDVIYVKPNPAKSGKIEVTAETVNGKKGKIELEVTDPTTVKSIDSFIEVTAPGGANVATFAKGEKTERELYYVKTASDGKKSLAKDCMYVRAVLLNQNDAVIPVTSTSATSVKKVYNKLEWKSSNNHVVSIAKTGTPGTVKLSFKETGTATITAKHPDFKTTYNFKVKVVDNRKVEVVFIDAPEDPVECYTGDVFDVTNYIDVITKNGAPYVGKIEVKPYHTSKVSVSGTLVTVGDRTGKCAVKVKAGKKEAKIYLKIKD